MRIFSITVLLLALAWSVPFYVQAFDFDDMEKIEKAEQEDLLVKAGQAARDWNFGEARSLLKQAQQKGYAPTEVETVEKLIADNESAKAERERSAEEARQAQIAAQEAERQRAAMVSSSSGGGSGSRGWVQIEVSCRSPMCSDSDLQVSPASGSDGGTGRFENGAIINGFDDRLDGVYVYSVRLEPFTDPQVVCTGSFTLNGLEDYVYLWFNTDCSDAGSSVHISQ